MKASEIASLFLQDPRNQTLAEALTSALRSVSETPDKGVGKRFHLKGLMGSSKSFCVAVEFRLVPAVHLILLPDKERAAYFLNDLEQVFEEKEKRAEEKKVLFFPSSYKRGYTSGVRDNQGLLLRTEVMNRLHQGGGGGYHRELP